MLNFDRSTVKHGTPNIKNDCHRWLSDSFRPIVHRIRFWPGLRPDPNGGFYSAPPDPLAVLWGHNSKKKKVERRKRKRGKGEK